MTESSDSVFLRPLRALQVFDAERPGSTASPLTLVDERLRLRLVGVLRDVADLAGFRAASVARLREDNHLQMIAVVGANISPAEMEKSTIARDIWLSSLGATGDWGRWKYCSGADSNEEVMAHYWLPDLPGALTEDDWDPRAELACPIHDHHGRLVACLFLDLPMDGKVPPPDRRDKLNQIGSLASRAILALIAAEDKRLQLRLLNATHADAATTDFRNGASGAIQALAEHMLVDSVEVIWFVPELADFARIEGNHTTVEGNDRDHVHGLWSHDEVLRVSPRIDADGTRRDGSLLVPIGTDGDCFGALRLWRRRIRAPWTRIEVRCARDFAGHLAQMARDHLWRTEEMDTVDALREQVAENTRLADGVRHDLATPLNAIRNYLDLLTTAQDDPELYQRILEALRVGTEQVRDVAEALDPFHSATSGRRQVDVVAVLHEIHALHSVRADHAGLTFDLVTDLPAAWVFARPEAVRRVLGNLTVNAIKYTPAGGHLTIETNHLDSTTLRMVWQDTGIGIAPEELPHVWDDFYRAPDARVRRNPGSGLGLPIVARLVGEMDGRVSIESKLDVGTRVTLELPLAPGLPKSP